MDLASLIVPSKELTTEYPVFPDFNITVAYLTRDELMKLRKNATTSKFNRSTRQPEEETDSELFQDLYIDAIIKGWEGLKYKYLVKMLPMNESAVVDMEAELEYSRDSARALMKNNSDLDMWITDLLADVENFTTAS